MAPAINREVAHFLPRNLVAAASGIGLGGLARRATAWVRGLRGSSGVAEEVSSVRATVHGGQRLADPSRLGVDGVREVLSNPTRTYVQGDGAAVFVQQVDGRYNVVVQGERGVITTLKNLSEKALGRLADRYGWTSQ